MAVTTVSDQTFDSDVLGSQQPVLVDFWAEWCRPCKMISPLLEELAEEMDGKLTVAKINIDDNPKTPSAYGVRGIPTLMLFKDGALSSTKVGTMNRSALRDWVSAEVSPA